MRKNLFKISCIVAVLIASVVLFSACFLNETPIQRIERVYGIKPPKNMEVVYNYRGKTFVGRAEQYTIFKLKEKPTAFLDKYFFINSDNEKWNNTYQQNEENFDEEILDFNIPETYFPRWSNNYFWQNFPDPKMKNIMSEDFGSATILYFQDEGKLIIWSRGQ